MSEPTSHVAGDRIGESYRIEAELGQGGMARVYRVLDERSGAHLALKQLVAARAQSSQLQTMFEREYHTLMQLAHPRIVRAFDYGLHADCPYYTMELLDGTDVRLATRAGALSVPEVCVLLRDTASALALIHSRRLVHRDVSPRNLWRTPDGRGKLIDFGTLVGMGPQTRAAGTAPFVPPEAVYAQPLDARCDLYALGALAYFLLTQRYAYPAHDISELRQHWKRRPSRPDAIKPELPAALCDLVMALLSLDARGRPASAAEVVERLDALADMPRDDERHLAQAFLTSPTLVGRSACSITVRKALLRARRGRCTALAIVAPAGLGRSRMLASSVLEAKLMGAAVVSLDAGATGTAPFALATALAERLVEIMPLAALASIESVAALGHVSPLLHRVLGEPALPPLGPYDRARKLSAAFVALVSAVSRQHHVLIAVDDVQRADAASLGVLARLRALSGSERLLLLTTCDQAALSQPAPLLEPLLPQDERIDLPPLAADETRALLGSLFGESPALDAAAPWLHELSQGSPQTCMQYAQYLLDHGLARYAAGRWHLPERLREQALPASLGAMLEDRLATWSADARSLALGLALARDESRSVWQPENHVLIEDFPRLLDDEDGGVHVDGTRATSHPARAFAAIDELVRAGMLRQHDSTYVLGQRAMVDALLRVTADADVRRMHRRLARILAQHPYQSRIAAVSHLQRAGEHERARQLLLAFTAHLGGSAAMDWGAMRVSVSATCTAAALEHFERHGGPARDGILLRRMLALTCSVYDWRFASCSDAQLAQLRSDLGMQHWEQTDPALPAADRARECMRRAQAAYDATPERERGLAADEALRELAACALSTYGAFVNSHDVAATRRFVPLLEPLRTLSPLVDMVAEICATGVDRVSARDVGDCMLASVQRVIGMTGLPDVLQIGCAAILVYTQAIEDVRRGRARAFALIDLVVPGAGEELFLVVHTRWLCHAFRGRADRAAQYRKQAELITEDDIWRRKASLFIEAELHALTGDLSSLQQTSEAIAELAAVFPGWRAWQAWTRGVMHRLRGELEAAQAELESAVALAPAGEHRAWVRAAPALAEVLLMRGKPQDALRYAAQIVAIADAQSLDPLAALAGERVRALAESALGDTTAAQASIERALARAKALECDGLPLAQLYAASARVQLAAGKARECAAALNAMRELIEQADAPALIHTYEALRAENTQIAVPELGMSIAPTRHAVTDYSQYLTEVQVRLGAHDERAARARQALQMLLDDSGAASGHLFLFDAGGLFAAASSTGQVAERLLSVAQRHLDAEISKTSSDAVTVADAPVFDPYATANAGNIESELVPVLLSDDAGGRVVTTGLALLAVRRAEQRLPCIDLVRAISRCLEHAGDSLAIPLDG